LFSIISPGNSNVITATVVVLFFNIGNGFFGIQASSMAGNGLLPLLQMSPGYNAFLLVSFGSCVAEPFDTTRWFIMRQLRSTGMIPFDADGVLAYETESSPWRSEALINLFMFGLTVRAVVLICFTMQSHFSFTGVMNTLSTHLRNRCACARCCDGKDKSMDDEEEDTAGKFTKELDLRNSMEGVELNESFRMSQPYEIESLTPTSSRRLENLPGEATPPKPNGQASDAFQQQLKWVMRNEQRHSCDDADT